MSMQTRDKAMDASIDKAWGRFEVELKRGSRSYPLKVECLHTDDTKTLMSKGHQDPAEFMAACEEWNGGPLQGWGKVRHGWGRTVPDRTGEYKFLMLSAKPHSRGAYPITTVVDDPAYDHE
jgi:hypothetical protein